MFIFLISVILWGDVINIRALSTFGFCSKKKLCSVYGKWTECLHTVDPATFDAHKKSDKKNSDEKKGGKQVFHFTDIKVTNVLSPLGLSQTGVCVYIPVAPEQCRRGARGNTSTYCRDRAGHPRQRTHLEDNTSTRQLGKGQWRKWKDKRVWFACYHCFLFDRCFFFFSVAVLCILHICHAAERAGQDHGGNHSSHR